jgi:hypothetical protein
MTDKTEFTLDISVNPASGFKPLPDRVAFDLCRAYPMPGGKLLLHNPRNGKRAMVMPEVYASLLRCRQFETLDQHVAHIIDSNPGMQGQQADMRNVLQTMLDSGIMVSAKKVCDQLKSEVKTVTAETVVPVVAIITWERPQTLERLLKSIAANCDTTKFHRLYVVDDSRKVENISQNQVLVQKFASEIETPLQYFGQDEQQALLDDLAKRIPEHKNAISYLADQSRWRDHWTSGLARNLALLLSCGHRLVMIDDDTICDVYNPPKPKPDITFSDSPREADFFDNEQDWASLQQAMNPDPINRHMQCLGLSFSEALAVLGQNHLKPAGLCDATALLVSELQPDSRVLMTECGSLGCPGTGNNTWLPTMAPGSLKRMLASGKKTTYALTRRKVWSGRNQPHFAPRPNMSQITGFDNREMLPPYLPIGRGEDRLFGYLLDFIFPTAITLDYPWAVPHLPLPERVWRNSDLDFTPSDSFPMFFFEKVIEYKSSCEAGSATDRLATLSAWFSDMAAAPDDSLINMYRDRRLNTGAMQLEQLSTLLPEAGSGPVDWQNYLRNGIRQLTDDLDKASCDELTIKGLPRTLEGAELIIFWKDTWAGFAAALRAWPEIRKAAAEIVGDERPLG